MIYNRVQGFKDHFNNYFTVDSWLWTIYSLDLQKQPHGLLRQYCEGHHDVETREAIQMPS